jgi:hypothetical protein
MENQVYFDCFTGVEDVIEQFSAPADALDNAEVFYANYTTPAYEGYATVVFEKEGVLYEVNGSHCSCYGLEGQWEPEVTSWEAIAMRDSDPLKELALRKIGK